MKNTVNITLLFVCVSFLISCNAEKKEHLHIKTLREEVKQNKNDHNKAMQFELVLREYVLHHPKDTNNPKFIFEAAEINMAPLQKYNDAERLFSQLYKTYPKHWLAPEALFRAAFTNDNLLNNKQKAENQYKEFIASFPSHQYTDDAEASLKTLYFSDEELNNFADSLANANKQIP